MGSVAGLQVLPLTGAAPREAGVVPHRCASWRGLAAGNEWQKGSKGDSRTNYRFQNTHRGMSGTTLERDKSVTTN